MSEVDRRDTFRLLAKVSFSSMTSAISIMLEPGQDNGLVVGRVTFEDRGSGYDFVSDDTPVQLQTYADTIRNNVEDYLHSRSTDALARVADAGWMLLDSLLGTVSSDGVEDAALNDEILDWLRTSDGSVTIDSNTIHAPWNFLYVSPDSLAFDPNKFVGCGHMVLQRLSMRGSTAPTWPQRKLLVIHGGHVDMVEETDRIAEHAAVNRVPCLRLPSTKAPIPDCPKAFSKAWVEASPSVLHIASHLRDGRKHASGERASALDSSIDVSHDAGLPLAHVLKAVGGKRDTMEMGFFNVCRLGRGSSTLDGSSAGMLSRRLACSISVDTLLENRAGMRFADAFYAGYLSGRPAGEAFATARQKVSASRYETIQSLCYSFTYMFAETLAA